MSAGRAVTHNSTRRLFGLARIAFAVVLSGLSFFLLRQLYYGDCFFPSDIVFPALALGTMAGFLWLGFELLRGVLGAVGMRAFAARLIAVVVAVAVYAAISWAVWQANPGPDDTKDDDFTRWYLSAFWSTGLLDITGNWSTASCGY